MDLTELIMTRVSHDLAGMSGAIYNTAELLEMDPVFASEAGPLLKESTAGLLARLRLFRALFGLGTAPVTTDLMVKYIKTLSAPLTLNGSISTRIQLACAFICAETLIRGGSITITGVDMAHVQIEAAGVIKADPALQDILSGSYKSEVTPKQAVILWLRHLLDKQGCQMIVEKSDQLLRMTVA